MKVIILSVLAILFISCSSNVDIIKDKNASVKTTVDEKGTQDLGGGSSVDTQKDKNSSDETNTNKAVATLKAETFETISLNVLVGNSVQGTLHADGATSYEIVDMPDFMDLNSTSGVVSIDANGSKYGLKYYDVILKDDVSSQRIVRAIKVQIFRDQSVIAGKLKRYKVTPSDANNSLVSISGRGYVSIIYDKQNNYWKALVIYYTTYSHNNQIKVINLTTQEEDKTYDKFLEGTPINGAGAVVGGDLNTYIRFSGKFTKYDADTQEIITIGDVPNQLGKNILYPSMVLGVDGKLVLGGSYNGKLSIAEYDITSKTYKVWEGLNVDASHPNGDNAANRNAAADLTHLYESTNGNGTGYRVYTMDKATSTGKKLASCPSWVTVAQGKYGCWVYIPNDSTDADNKPIDGGVYWLKDGKMTKATNGLNQDTCPWDNHGETFVSHSVAPVAKPYKISSTGHSPAPGSTDTSLWFKKEVSTPWIEIPIHNVKNYPIKLDDIAKVGSKIISVGDAYAGFAVLDVETSLSKNYSGLLSFYANTVINGKLYFSGYPSGMLYEYDPKLPWDNTQGSYNPNVKSEKNNPKFIGYSRYNSPNIKGASVGGTGGGQHKNYVLLKGEGNMLYAFGEWERDGRGLGITTVDLDDDYRMVGYRDEALMSSHTPRAGVVTDDYFVILCETFSGANKLDLAVMDKKSNEIHNLTLPSNAVMQWSSITRGSTIIRYDKNKVLIASANDKRELVLIGVDIDTSEILYNHTFAKTFTSTGGSLEKMSDGNIYLGLDGATVLVEPQHGWIEEVNDISINGQRVEGSDHKVYLVNGVKTYVIDEPYIKEGIKNISTNEGDFFDYISLWLNQGCEAISKKDTNKSISISITKASDSDNQGELLLKTKYNLKGSFDYTLRFNAKITKGIAKVTGFRTYNVSTYTDLDYTLVNGVNEIKFKGDGSNKFPRFRFDTTKLFDVNISNVVLIDDIEK